MVSSVIHSSYSAPIPTGASRYTSPVEAKELCLETMTGEDAMLGGQKQVLDQLK